MWTRRQFLAASVLGWAGMGVRAANEAHRLWAPARDVVEKGLVYLATHQVQKGPLAGALGENRSQGNVAITSLAALAFMSGGHQPGRGRYGPVVEKALRYVLGQADARGFLNYPEASLRGPMYNHGFGTLFLAEVYGMVHAPKLAAQLRDILKRAVHLILTTQNAEGGWRYEPVVAAQADLSVTVAQVMALRAARNAGLDVPKAIVDRCAAYLQRCQVFPEGGFRYMPQVGPPTFPRSAAGLVGLHCCGIYEGVAIENARKYLWNYLPSKRPRPIVDQYFLYGHYYAALAMRQAGGSAWAEWYAAIRDELCQPGEDSYSKELPFLRYQETRAWSDPHYTTALACIILQLPLNYLPIFQH